ncbi:MAG: YsnF/AvaK domain-containing protein [Candidatus Nitrosocosmicus sp.]
MSRNDKNNNIDWDNIIKKEAIGLNGEDLGEVLEVGKSHIITQKGIINKKRYYLPKKAVAGFDGSVVKFNMTHNDLDQYKDDGDHMFDNYSSFKSSDMSKELETKIPVMAENLEVTKRLTENKIKIVKEPVKEIRKVDMELTHEEISIERIPVKNESSSTQQSNVYPDKTKTEMIITLKREEPVIKKQSFVKEEVIVKKKPVTETKTITDVVVNERVNYDNDINKDI